MQIYPYFHNHFGIIYIRKKEKKKLLEKLLYNNWSVEFVTGISIYARAFYWNWVNDSLFTRCLILIQTYNIYTRNFILKIIQKLNSIRFEIKYLKRKKENKLIDCKFNSDEPNLAKRSKDVAELTDQLLRD